MNQAVGRQYADVIVDITHERLDRVYQYRIPESLRGKVTQGSCVEVPFGKGDRQIRAYVIALQDRAEVPEESVKEIIKISEKGLTIETKLIRLAAWIRNTYGCTMIQALKTVLPVKERENRRARMKLMLAADRQQAEEALALALRKHHAAKARLLEHLLKNPAADQAETVRKLGIGSATIRALARDGIIRVTTDAEAAADTKKPDPAGETTLYMKETETAAPAEGQQEAVPTQGDRTAVLTEGQREAVRKIMENWEHNPGQPVLIEGVTGSGKTLVYMELADAVLREGKQVIVLIPEIALSWQIVRRFRERFGDIVAVLHSRMGKSERFTQYEKARRLEAQIMIGPRSALFTPFSNTGLIIIDEEQEQSYRSEETPRYDARETAVARAVLDRAHVVMGSATPSVDSYAKAKQGTYFHVTLPERYGNARLPEVQIVDMRDEMKSGNRGMLSHLLQDEIQKRLERNEQTILFLNKRGLAGFLSCRNCGEVLKCPHCDVSLTAHINGTMICHYCNYKTKQVKICPHCGSPHIYGFRAGTQKAEQAVHVLFPEARILRMDADTTRGKEGHDKILKAFASHEADILIGTQMIVKGHDFPAVTLVGVLLADLSLYASDYRAAERTYQLLVQAVGRAGRGTAPGTAVIQSYSPDHYSIQAAAAQDYQTFYEEEMSMRKLMHYPPAAGLLTIHLSCRDEEKLQVAAGYVRKYLLRVRKDESIRVIGPAPEAVGKVQDYYREVISVKAETEAELIRMRRQLEAYVEINTGFREIRIQYDLNR